MNIKENIRIAIFSIRTNLMRSLLTMLGIIIGVAAVIAIITIGNGGRDFIVGMIQDMGSSVINISVNTSEADASDYITAEDIEAIKKLDSVSYVSPVVISMGSVSTKQENGFGISIAGNEDLGPMMSAGMTYGRFFTRDEYKSAAHVAVLDSISAKTMFGYDNPVGERMDFTVGEQTVQLTVIGVSDASMMSMEGMSEDMSSMMSMGQTACSIMIPATLSDLLNGNSGRYEMCYIMADTEDQLDAAGSAAMNVIYTRHGNFGSNAYNVVNMATYIELLDTVINVFTTFIAAVSAISLIVGGIGVMNIMLVTVTERTREIGIRKALGAKTSTILFQFLTESIILCLLGGLIGLIIGSVGAFAVAYYMGIPIEMKISTILIAVGFSTAIGVFFGIYPARRAARMQPIDALRRM
ncbi:MAG: ABC transporter permease [Clostridia bacterium]|nr:ABC transporter permease [Clostridia bacterium]